MDLINAAFEFLAGIFVLNHCRVLLKDKDVKGVSVLSEVFFIAWGFWNVIYYPHLGQDLSFKCGVFLCVTNLIKMALLLKYKEKNNNEFSI